MLPSVYSKYLVVPLSGQSLALSYLNPIILPIQYNRSSRHSVLGALNPPPPPALIGWRENHFKHAILLSNLMRNELQTIALGNLIPHPLQGSPSTDPGHRTRLEHSPRLCRNRVCVLITSQHVISHTSHEYRVSHSTPTIVISSISKYRGEITEQMVCF